MTTDMQAVGFTEHLPITNPNSLIDFRTAKPHPKPHDLLVAIQGISVNPVDVGVRKGGHGVLKTPRIIGWDAYGIVAEVGQAVTLFKPGDAVFYAGDFKRAGSDSEYQIVDERIVGRAPIKLTIGEMAAMPLTSLTSYEALFEQLQIPFALSGPAYEANQEKTILIINGAGGVGSVATQLAHLVGLKVIATASRPETIEWVLAHGADQTVNHRHDLTKELAGKEVDYIMCLSNLDAHWNEIVALIKPAGRIVSITENRHLIDLQKLTKKRATFAWEWMYSKSYYQTDDMITQHQILNHIADLLDQGLLVSTMKQSLTGINAKQLRKAHALVESNQMIGKVVLVR